MHAPFLGLKVNRYSTCLQEKFEGKGQGQTTFFEIQLIERAQGRFLG